MKLRIDPDSPVPLYHQISEGIRYLISTGKLSAGTPLPPVRDAARTFDVNMHTVRRAYAELAKQGMVETLRPKGTRVLSRPSRGDNRRGVNAFLQRVLREAHKRHGLGPDELATLIANASIRERTAERRVYFVECSESQCLDHAAEIEARWAVHALPWCISREEGPPEDGDAVATYFHYNEIRLHWPHRLQGILFVAIHPDPQLAASIPPVQGRCRNLLLCEFDEPMAKNIAADLSVLFPVNRFSIEPHVVRRPGELLASSKRTPVLFTPRAWAGLSRDEQRDPRAFKVRYVIEPTELEEMGARFHWAPRRTAIRRMRRLS